MEQRLWMILQLFGGAALFLYSMDTLTDALQQAAGDTLRQALARLTAHPLAGVLTGAAVTAVVQSSSAVTVLVLGLVGAGLLTLQRAVPVVFGANIGTTVTAVLASIGQSRDTKRAAAAHALFNLTGAAAFCALLPWYAGLVAMISPKGPELEVIARQIANAHTLFNLICTAAWLPLTPLMVRLVCGLVPDRPPKARNS